MKKTKMFLVGMLMAVMVFTLAACGSSNQEAQEAGSNAEVSAEQSASEPEAEEPDVSEQETEEVSPEPEEADSELKEQEESQPEVSEEPSSEGEIGAAAESLSTETAKETAYGSGTTLVTATDGEGIYDLEFEDGVLTVAYYEDYEGKGGWGGDSSMGIENCRFYGMTVEEAVESLEEMGFKAEIK